ncbi:MAG: PaaI family thioesterase [Verrucomicrobia bacterium]|nr:PaaI family thioesterase [Verrucomicrobiota bacterium]
MLHGGRIALLLDGAMTHCLCAQDRVGGTAELKIRYRQPVAVEQPLLLHARLVRSTHAPHHLEAPLVQDHVVKVTAKGKFMEPPP